MKNARFSPSISTFFSPRCNRRLIAWRHAIASAEKALVPSEQPIDTYEIDSLGTPGTRVPWIPFHFDTYGNLRIP
ncbi:DNA-directed RNA polymerase subunit A'' [Gossypium arboreum]|uniref:DNA-directed RNA polymerase subunit A n=1 Tax=Gossypium arboreum TaxID=29729 RepID=A0A0B0N3V3_GOSAR|nr:DNA-directed RNA polymerase subunit A'' [Gossypium arboreum]